MTRGIILLCAGGTGGHLFPAEALAHELGRRDWDVHLATDHRAGRYAKGFPASEIHVVHSATPSGKNPISILKALWMLRRGYYQSKALIRKLSPELVAGFGGYPTLPPVFAAQRLGVPTLVHDANAVMGRANRLLARKANLVAMGFSGTNEAPDSPIVITGNPVRPAVLAAANRPYPERSSEDPFHLLVFGGSQGAKYFSQIVPAAIDLLGKDDIAKLRIVHQARPEDSPEVESYYQARHIEAQVAPFFADLPEQIAAANLVICRAGASSVSELAVIGRPCVLVPYPFALDHDQAMNAKTVAASGGAWIYMQSELTPEILADRLKNAINDPKGLALASEKAKKIGKPDAAARLADCVERIAADRNAGSRG